MLKTTCKYYCKTEFLSAFFSSTLWVIWTSHMIVWMTAVAQVYIMATVVYDIPQITRTVAFIALNNVRLQRLREKVKRTTVSTSTMHCM